VTNTKQFVQLLCALSTDAVIHCRALLCTPASATTYTNDDALVAHEATALESLVTVLSLRGSMLMQLCIPGLENRAVLFPPLTHSTELAPGRHYVLVPCEHLQMWLCTGLPMYMHSICPTEHAYETAL